MKPLMRQDAYWAAVDDGAYIVTHHGPVRLNGRSVASWIERVAPQLDGRRTLADLTAGLSPRRRAMVDRLVTMLHDCGAVRDAAADGMETADVPGELAPEIGYISYFRGSAAAEFARYRARTGVVIGSGRLAAALACAARHSGLQHVRVVPPDAWLTDAGQTAARIDGAGLVVQVVGDESGLDWSHILERCCTAAQIPLGQVVLGAEEAWLVPVALGETGNGWSAARLRLSSPVRRHAGADLRDVVLTAIAAQLVQSAFRTLTGIAPPSSRARLIQIRLDSLRTEEHRFLPHPFALAATATTEDTLRRRIAALARGPSLSEKEFSRQAASCVDDRLGIFHFTGDDWAQVPLQVAGAVVAGPAGMPPGPARLTSVGAAFDFQAARCQAALAALARYSARMVDPRRLIDASTGAPLEVAGDPGAMLAAIRAGAQPAAVWGCVAAESALDDSTELRLVPAAVAFPCLRDPAPPDDVAMVGVAAGYNWPEVVLNGLLAQCRVIALAETAEATTPYPLVDLAAAPLDGLGKRCHALLQDLGELPQVYDLAGSLGVPTFAFCRGAATIAVAAGATVAAALDSGLRQVLLWVQARIHGQPWYSPRPPGHLPERVRGDRVRDPDQQPLLDAVEVAARLRKLGRRAMVVALDHDPGVVDVTPYVVRVVVGHA